jgi:phosphohistidine swiveling domain-containing protein
METLKFGTKAETLQRLYQTLTTGRVKKPFFFTVDRWESERDAVLDEIRASFSGRIVVRSSCRAEDTALSSNAGRFASVLDVDPGDRGGTASAIDAVIDSYGDMKGDEDQVLVQEQLAGVALCGVAFTRDLDTLAPYYIVNYDDSGSFDGVTSGTGVGLKTWIRSRDRSSRHEDPGLTQIIRTIQEMEELFNSTRIDVEFALDGEFHVWILQARPIANRTAVCDDENVTKYLGKMHKKIDKLNRPHVNLLGRRTIFGVMPDWNPAEIIGVKPRKLALTLYKELITDRVWAYQRGNYGYRNLRSYPLLVSFLGCPYIDTRVSFNSFIPESFADEAARKIVDYYLTRLAENPECHDKVEFDIVISCCHFDIENRIRALKEAAGLTEREAGEFRASLAELTNGVMAQDGLCRKDLAKIGELKRRYRQVIRSEMPPIEKIYWLIEDCKRYGTLPFAGIARAAFIAVQMMRSLVATEVIEDGDYEGFVNSLSTVSKELSREFAAMEGDDDKAAFLAKFGHLRPGTYDVLSDRYDESFDEYFKVAATPPERGDDEGVPFSFCPRTMARIESGLAENGILLSAEEFLDFVRTAIEGREYAKLVFTRNISQVLLLLKGLGKKYGICDEDISHLNIATVINLYASLDAHDLSDILASDIAINKRAHAITSLIKLPPLIRDAEDIYGFFLEEGQPNFVSTRRVEGDVVREADLLETDLKDKIVFIKSADPGYDWIFSRYIGGLITMYGGANSHMAIRAAELGLPAVIGCGEKRYTTWQNYSSIEMDCAGKIVREVAA